MRNEFLFFMNTVNFCSTRVCHLSLLPQFGSKRAEILHTDSSVPGPAQTSLEGKLSNLSFKIKIQKSG